MFYEEYKGMLWLFFMENRYSNSGNLLYQWTSCKDIPGCNQHSSTRVTGGKPRGIIYKTNGKKEAKEGLRVYFPKGALSFF